MRISPEGIAFIKRQEGVEYEAYQDSVGIWTIGVGHTGEDVEPGLVIDDEEVDRLLTEDIRTVEQCIDAYCDVELTQNQFDALCSFVFNVGCHAFKKSTLLELLNNGNTAAAAKQFSRWNKAGGKPLAGLTRRRKEESVLFTA